MGEKIIFSFDIGTGSIGECVRKDEKIEHVDSLLLPAEFAAITEVAKKRRQLRTRQAHKARERWWREEAKKAGIAVLETRQPLIYGKEKINAMPDPRMLREFPAKGDDTIYTSALLRIALLQGRKLEGWQIFKAVWSAMQRRGYDADLPWKKRVKRNLSEDETEKINQEKDDEKAKDEKANREAVSRYEGLLKEKFGDKKEFHYPCCLEAFRMGIWDPERPDDLSGKIGTNPSPARNKDGADDAEKIVAPRSLVEKELLALLENASLQFPQLKGREKHILYGPGEMQYSSYLSPDFAKHRGRVWDWQGLLGQKIPRFDNRIISKCALIPRLNVCRADDILNQQATFLMKLKNMRYFDRNGEEKGLSAEQISELFRRANYKAVGDVKKKKEKGQEGKYSIKIGKKDWKKYISEDLKGHINPAHAEVEAPKIGGRSRFCRPALAIIKDILLTGKSPREKYSELMNESNSDPKAGLVRDDYKFLLDMPDEWDSFWIPDSRDADARSGEMERKKTIEKIIGRITNPVVRHRLALFCRRLDELAARYGKPDRIMLELVRDELYGKDSEAKKRLIALQNRNKKERDHAAKEVRELGLKGGDAIEKMKLFREQNGVDPYQTGEPLSETEIEGYQIDHIFPRALGGPDAFYNKVLTRRTNNSNKGDRLPFKWIGLEAPRWDALKNWVERNKNIGSKKAALLMAQSWEEAEKLIEKYTELAGTSYIAKSAQRISALFFGWDWHAAGSKQKIKVISGVKTAKIRRNYKLDRLLWKNLPEAEYKKLIESGGLDKKNRENPLHHALDAIVLSVADEYRYDKEKDRDVLPPWFTHSYVEGLLDRAIPKQLRYEQSVLADTIYARREKKTDDGVEVNYISRAGTGVTMRELLPLGEAKKRTKNIFDEKIRADFERKLTENPSEDAWQAFIANYTVGGSRPRKIAMIESSQKADERISKFAEIGKVKGQFYKNKKEAQGQFICKDAKGKWVVVPVYAFESLKKKNAELKKEYIVWGLLRSKCRIFLNAEIKLSDKVIRAGHYIVKTVPQDGRAEMSTVDSSLEYRLPVKKLIEEGKMEIVVEKKL